MNISCLSTVDYNSEKKELLKLHQMQREAHLEKNAAKLVSQFSDDFISVNRGAINKPTKEESIAKFSQYFQAVDFICWDDIHPPTFNFSVDATMATSIVDKLVIIKDRQNNKIDTTIYCWIAVYKKHKNKWTLAQMASTDK
jgi:hypothetical protein